MRRYRLSEGEPPSKSLGNFTNRVYERGYVAELLTRRSGGHLPVLTFFGVGGTGKSWLLSRLREEAAAMGGIPIAYLDCSVKSGGVRYHSDYAVALADLQQQLGISCPRFEVAYQTMLHKIGHRDTPANSRDQAAGFGWQIAVALGQDAASWLPGTNVAGKVLEKLGEVTGQRLRDTPLGQWLVSRGADDFLRSLRNMSYQEIYDQLVCHLAADLHEHLPVRDGIQCRAIIFIDSYEDLIRGAGRRAGSRDRVSREQWIQDFYRALLDDRDVPCGTVLFVIGGRDRLEWTGDFDDSRYLEQHQIDGLSHRDACEFLEKCKIVGDLQRAILRVCTATGDWDSLPEEQQYHPFSLGLCADAVAQERTQGRQPEPASFALTPGDTQQLVERFLASFDAGQEAYVQWMYKLSLPPHWDETAARHAFSSAEDVQQDAAWEALKSYSFVEVPQLGEHWWSLHAQMREALRASHSERRSRAERDHQFWRAYWDQRSDEATDEFAGLAWYHSYCLDRESALAEWQIRAETARQNLLMSEHFGLLGWWGPTRHTKPDRTSASVQRALGFELQEASVGSRIGNVLRAIACYGRALQIYTEAETPRDWAITTHYLGRAYQVLPSGNREDNLRRAIKCYEAALRVFTESESPLDWASTVNNLALAYSDLPTGDRADNLRRAIACNEAVLRVYTEENAPLGWAMAMHNIGKAYQSLPTGDVTVNLARAAQHYDAALRHYNEAQTPREWADTLNNLGLLFKDLRTGDRQANLQTAIRCFEQVLRVYTETKFPWQWAATMNNLGTVSLKLTEGDYQEIQRRTIACFEAALRVYTETTAPFEWATTMNNLGNAYRSRSPHIRLARLDQAIECYQASLRVFTEDAFPREWAATMYNLGLTYSKLLNGDYDANCQRAEDCFKHALRVRTQTEMPAEWAETRAALELLRAVRSAMYADVPDHAREIQRLEEELKTRTEMESPREWAATLTQLGNALLQVQGTERVAALQRAVTCYHSVLRVYTETGSPKAWGATMNNLAAAYMQLPTTDGGANMQRAIECCEASLRVRTEMEMPDDWAMTLRNLGIAYQHLPTGDTGANLQRAIECYEAILRAYNKDRTPNEWAQTMHYLGEAFFTLPNGDRAANLRIAIEHYEAARSIRSTEYPLERGVTLYSLGRAFHALALEVTRHEPSSPEVGGLKREAQTCFDLASDAFERAGRKDLSREAAVRSSEFDE